MSTNKLGILFDRIRWEEKELARQLEMRGVSYDMIDAKMQVLPLNTSKLPSIPERVLNRCVSYYRGQNITAVYEAHGISVINSSKILEVCGNKLLTSQVLSMHGIPTPRTIVAFSAESAMQAVETAGFPCVMKPIVGSWGRQVVPIRDKEIAESMIEMREQQADSMQTIFYVQEMIKRPPRDIRCIAVGEEIVASVYRYASAENWKTNVALGGHTEPCKLTPELEEILMKTVNVIGKGVVGIDLMERGDSDYVVHEVNGTVEFKGAQLATATSIAGRIADYVASSHEDFNKETICV